MAEFGLFNDEGLLETFGSEELAKAALAVELPEDPHAYVSPVCEYHPEEPATWCEECHAEDEDEGEES